MPVRWCREERQGAWRVAPQPLVTCKLALCPCVCMGHSEQPPPSIVDGYCLRQRQATMSHSTVRLWLCCLGAWGKNKRRKRVRFMLRKGRK
jgi:hypothetical protein